MSPPAAAVSMSSPTEEEHEPLALPQSSSSSSSSMACKLVQSPSRIPHTSSAPWLVFLQGSHNRCRYKSQIFFSFSDQRFYVRNIRQLKIHIYTITSYGCFLMMDPQLSGCFLWNPATMARVDLPKPVNSMVFEDIHSANCILSSSPFSDYGCCKLMCFFPCSDYIMFCHPGRLDDTWIPLQCDSEGDNALKDVVACGGQFYGVTRKNNLAIFNFDPPHPKITILEIASPGKARVCFNSFNLLESCGEIFLVTKFRMNFYEETGEIQVLKLDLANRIWEEVDDIGDRSFFLNEFSASSLPSNMTGINKGCIYFTEYGNKHLYVYDLNQGIISRSLPCPKLKRLRFGRPFFLMPTPAL